MSDVVTFALNKRQLDALRQKGIEMGLEAKSLNLTAKAILLSILECEIDPIGVEDIKEDIRAYLDSRLDTYTEQWDYTLDLRLQPILDRLTALEEKPSPTTTTTKTATPKTRKTTTTNTKTTTTGTVPKRGRKPKTT